MLSVAHDRPARVRCNINIGGHSNRQGGPVFVGSGRGTRQPRREETARKLTLTGVPVFGAEGAAALFIPQKLSNQLLI